MIIYVLDELEKNDRNDLKSSKFLGFLDGASSRSNVVILATANDISNLPDFLVNRPGRFEKIYEFSLNDPEILRATAEGIIPDRFKENNEVIGQIMTIANATKVNTIDHLRFIVQEVLFDIIRKQKNKNYKKPLPNLVDKSAVHNTETQEATKKNKKARHKSRV